LGSNGSKCKTIPWGLSKEVYHGLSLRKGHVRYVPIFFLGPVAVLALKPNAETCPICTSLPSTGLVPPIHEDDALAHVQACIELAQDNML